jgi:membrane-associated phospholipid phosphatase
MVAASRFALLTLLAASLLPAQSPRPGVHGFLRDFTTIQKEIWLSPIRMDRNQTVSRALPIVLGTASLLAVDRRLTRSLPNSPDQIRWGNRISHAGALYTLAAVTAVPLSAARSGRRPYAASVGRASIDALAAAAASNYALKFSLGRQRPTSGSGNGAFFRGGDSFPSGHSMTAWAVSTAIARHPRTPRWARILSCGAAAAVSLSRIAAHRHFAADVFAGAALGGLIGNHAVSRVR